MKSCQPRVMARVLSDALPPTWRSKQPAKIRQLPLFAPAMARISTTHAPTRAPDPRTTKPAKTKPTAGTSYCGIYACNPYTYTQIRGFAPNARICSNAAANSLKSTSCFDIPRCPLPDIHDPLTRLGVHIRRQTEAPALSIHDRLPGGAYRRFPVGVLRASGCTRRSSPPTTASPCSAARISRVVR